MYDGGSTVTTTSSPGIFGAIFWLIFIAAYLYFAYMQYKIAIKCGYKESAWWSFIPIMNTILLIKMAGKPIWWFFLLLVPLVNVILFFVLWIAVAKNIGQPAVWGFCVGLPLINFIAIAILAYSGPNRNYAIDPNQTPRQRTLQNVG